MNQNIPSGAVPLVPRRTPFKFLDYFEDKQADSVRFARPGAARGGHTFKRATADEWTATLHPGSPDGQPTVYIMRRVQR